MDAAPRLAWSAMADSRPAPERRARALMGLVAASALAYPLLVCAVQLVVAQLFTVDVAAIVLWLAVGVVCSVAFVAAVRWGAERRVLSAWLLLGLAPPVLFELWLVWPRFAA
jgi:small ligand-binding sensory domain FIST